MRLCFSLIFGRPSAHFGVSLIQGSIETAPRNMTEKFQFERELPIATIAEIKRLQEDGYVIYKEWTNGIEMRKGKPFREWLLAVHILFPVLLFAGYMRSVVNNFFGYKHRILVTLAENEAEIFFV
jgi:hypothetical protein